MTSASTRELLRIMCTDFRRDLSEKQRKAFDAFRRQESLTERQEHWVLSMADRLGLAVAPAENVFSEMPEDRQREHVERAAAVRLPWERPGYVKASKPPGGRP